MKYLIYHSSIPVIYPNGSADSEQVTGQYQKITDLLAEGYEIYSAIPVSTGNGALIDYFLRKPIENES